MEETRKRAYCVEKGDVLGAVIGVFIGIPTKGGSEQPCIRVFTPQGVEECILLSEVGGRYSLEPRLTTGDHVFVELKKKHEKLVETYDHEKDSFVSFVSMEGEIRTFIEECSESGAQIWHPDDREYVRTMISYWTAILRSGLAEYVETSRLKRFAG